MDGLDIGVVALLAAVAMLAGCVDAIAGGGGLLTIPALLLAGFDPVTAVATNKVQGSFGAASATVAFARAHLIDWRDAVPMAAVASIGAIGGALTVGTLPTDLLAGLMPLVLVAVALYFAFAAKLGDADAARRITPAVFTATVALGVGFYDGLFGPGAGSFYMLGFVALLGFGVTRATAHTKFLNLASNVSSLMLFAAIGAVVWPVGLVMGVSAFLGAQVGSRLALRSGARIIRPLIVLVSCAAAARLMADPGNPLRRFAAAALGL